MRGALIALHYIALHRIVSHRHSLALHCHCMTLHRIALPLHRIALHCHCIALPLPLHCIAVHHTTHYFSLRKAGSTCCAMPPRERREGGRGASVVVSSPLSRLSFLLSVVVFSVQFVLFDSRGVDKPSLFVRAAIVAVVRTSDNNTSARRRRPRFARRRRERTRNSVPPPNPPAARRLVARPRLSRTSRRRNFAFVRTQFFERGASAATSSVSGRVGVDPDVSQKKHNLVGATRHDNDARARRRRRRPSDAPD